MRNLSWLLLVLLMAQTDWGARSVRAQAVGADPIVVTNCRLVATEKQEVPSQRDGILLVLGTDLKDEETCPPDRLVIVKIGDRDRRFRRLKEGDAVAAGQLVALLDDRLARDDCAIRRGQIAAGAAELAAAEQARDEAKDRYLTQLKLRSAASGPATSEEDVGGAKVLWYKHHFEAQSKQEAIALARLELHQAETLLGMYEIRSTIAGVVKRVYKNPGEAVKSLEPVVDIRNLARLRAEGLVDAHQVPFLREGLPASIETTPSQGPQRIFSGHFQDITAVAISNRPRFPEVLSASEDGTVRVWSQAANQEPRILPHGSAVLALACTPSGAAANLCLTGTADGSGWLWDLNQRGATPLFELKGQHHGKVLSVVFSPDGKSCATAGEDHEICLWDTATGTPRFRFPRVHTGDVTSLQFPLSSCLVSAGRDNTLRIWSVAPDQARLEKTWEQRTGDMVRLGVTRDGQFGLIDLTDGLHLVSLGHATSAGVVRQGAFGALFGKCALFSPDSQFILTAGRTDCSLQLWQTPTGPGQRGEVRRLISAGRAFPTCAAYAPDGTFVVAGTKERQILEWTLPAKEDMLRSFPATITLVEQAVETGANQVRVWAELPNPEGLLIPGMTVSLRICPRER